MPRRDDLKTIAIIGSGPIVIGQACEFDYSGMQALKVLREEGYRTVLVNSNPATIMTDPGWADATYLEPLDLAGVSDVLRRERPDALLPTLGGQTALNLAMAAARGGRARRARDRADRRLREGDPHRRGPRGVRRRRWPRSACGCRARRSPTRVEEARAALGATSGCPVVDPAGVHARRHGGGVRPRRASFEEVVARGLAESPIGQVLVEESVAGWGEFELEVIRDKPTTW